MMQVYEERKWCQGESETLILVPTEILVTSTEDFKRFTRKNPDKIQAGTYICLPGKCKRVRIEKSVQTKIFE